jgi:hypothetical protein
VELLLREGVDAAMMRTNTERPGPAGRADGTAR